ncbi:MAG: RDD family protein [Bdellovibrionota bacterium]
MARRNLKYALGWDGFENEQEESFFRSSPAGFWLRVWASFYDSLLLGTVVGLSVTTVICSVVYMSSQLPFARAFEEFKYAVQMTYSAWIVLGFASMLSFGAIGANILYGALFESSRLQATPGKILLGLIVTDLSGQRISFAQALNRNMRKHRWNLIWIALWTVGFCCFLLPGPLWAGGLVLLPALVLPFIGCYERSQAAFSRHKQTSYDEMSDCLVEKLDRSSELARLFFASLAAVLMLLTGVVTAAGRHTAVGSVGAYTSGYLR